MPELLKTIVKIFTYKEPSNEERFELLEGKNEGKNIELLTKQQDISKVETTSKERKQPKKKQPLTIEEWNNSKNEEPDLFHKESGKVVSESIDNNLTYVKRIFKIPQNQDIYIREFKIAYKTRAFLLFVDGMVDKTTINNIVLRELLDNDKFVQFHGGCPVEYISNNVLSIYQINIERDLKKITGQVLSGNSALFIDGCAKSLIIESRGYEKRSVEKPVTETVIRGSQEGFSENLRTNITLLRKIIKNENLITEIHTVEKPIIQAVPFCILRVLQIHG